MKSRIAIRREDKNRWERRAPLTPDHVAELITGHDVDVVVQPSSLRAFDDQDYGASGAKVEESIDDCPIVFGVKEIPIDKLQPGRTYVYFSHVMKGQASNMPMLRRLMELGCTLIDYELIADAKGRRLIFFGRHAGYAGMIDSLWALGQRLAYEGFSTPLEDIRLAHQYSDLDEALRHIARVGDRIRHRGLPTGLRPIVAGFTGEGNVSGGAQEVFGRLPVEHIEPEELLELSEARDRPRNVLYRVLLPPSTTVERIDGGTFDWNEYVGHPERYRGVMDRWLPRLTMLINGIYWEPAYPRLVTKAWLKELWRQDQQPKLRVIGDISCDIDGSIEVTVKSTTPGDPVYVVDVDTGQVTSGVAGRGPVVMSVDNLPCELPVESSQHFGDSLMKFVPPMARCDWTAALDDLKIPREIKGAIIVHRGQLTARFSHLEKHVGEP